MKQYASSPAIQKLISDRKGYFPNDWANEFYNDVRNVDTAQSFGLDIWGRIVVIDRSLRIDTIDRAFGYYEAWSGQGGVAPGPGPVIINGLAFVLAEPAGVGLSDDRITPFNDAPFYDGLQASSVVSLSDEVYRKIIIAKAFANIADCTIPTLNKALRYLFDGSDSRRCYATTNNLMGLSYVFEFELTPIERTLAISAGVIPRPAGVKLTITQVNIGGTFGFAEAGMWQPFDNGVFFGDDGVANAI